MTPNHQFFDNEFRFLQNCRNGYVVCPISGLTPDKFPGGPLVDGYRSPLSRQDLPLPSADFYGTTNAKIEWCPMGRSDSHRKGDIAELVGD